VCDILSGHTRLRGSTKGAASQMGANVPSRRSILRSLVMGGAGAGVDHAGAGTGLSSANHQDHGSPTARRWLRRGWRVSSPTGSRCGSAKRWSWKTGGTLLGTEAAARNTRMPTMARRVRAIASRLCSCLRGSAKVKRKLGVPPPGQPRSFVVRAGTDWRARRACRSLADGRHPCCATAGQRSPVRVA
jgi:hypothetical protein